MTDAARADLWSDIRDSFKRPAFWAFASWLDIAVRYRRAALGFFWALVPPALFVGVLGLVYAGLMGHGTAEYLPFLSVGYLIWRYLIQTSIDSASIIRNHKAFLQEGRINVADLLLRVIVRGGVYFLFGLPTVVAVFVWSDSVSLGSLLSLFVTLPIFLVVLALACLHIALLGARTPDVGEFIATVLMFAFLLTPILWYPSQPHGGAVLQTLTKLNPIAHMIEFVRRPALGEGWAVRSSAIVTGLGLVLTLTGHYLYRNVARYVAIWL